MDWLSRLFEMMPVRGRLDLRCSYSVPWRIGQGPGVTNEVPYHAVVAGWQNAVREMKAIMVAARLSSTTPAAAHPGVPV